MISMFKGSTLPVVVHGYCVCDYPVRNTGRLFSHLGVLHCLGLPCLIVLGRVTTFTNFMSGSVRDFNIPCRVL